MKLMAAEEARTLTIYIKTLLTDLYLEISLCLDREI